MASKVCEVMLYRLIPSCGFSLPVEVECARGDPELMLCTSQLQPSGDRIYADLKHREETSRLRRADHTPAKI